MSISDDLNVLDEAPPLGPACRHLRSKGMYVYGDGSEDPRGDGEGSIYWCLQTMKTFGEDDRHVNARDCRDGSRSCYEAI